MDNIATNEEIEDNHLGSETDSKFEQLLDAEEQKLDQESPVVTDVVDSNGESGDAVSEEGLIFENPIFFFGKRQGFQKSNLLENLF